jgi:uncharacterized C2H2 Zn-finger protein
MLSTEFLPRCPNCLEVDFQPVEPHAISYLPYGGEELYHCNLCGKVFEADEAVELRLLEPMMNLS